MKQIKLFPALLLALAITVGIIACGSSSSGSSASTSPLAGTWKMMTIKNAGSTTTTDMSASGITYTVAANGNYTVSFPADSRGPGTPACSASGTSTSTATTITGTNTADTCNTSNVGTSSTSDYSISGTTLTLTETTGSNAGQVITCLKQ